VVSWGRFGGDYDFFERFGQIARRVTRAAELLQLLFENPGQRAERAAEITDLEHEADHIVREVNVRIDTSLITPIDSEDVHEVAGRLDSVLDHIEDVALRAVSYGIRDTREPAARLSLLIARAGNQLEHMVKEIKHTTVVLEGSKRVRAIEEEGDVEYGAAMSALFDGHPDPLEVIKWKDIYSELEDTLDACRHAAGMLESITLKHA
jgi:predicted phosphate transport protein (TIGR00153 family)